MYSSFQITDSTPAVIQNGRKIMVDVEMAHDILRRQTGKTDN